MRSRSLAKHSDISSEKIIHQSSYCEAYIIFLSQMVITLCQIPCPCTIICVTNSTFSTALKHGYKLRLWKVMSSTGNKDFVVKLIISYLFKAMDGNVLYMIRKDKLQVRFTRRNAWDCERDNT